MAAPKPHLPSRRESSLSAVLPAAQTFAFPVSALGPRISAAAAAVTRETQAPREAVAHHLLTLAAMSAQRVATLCLPTGQYRPLSCYFLTIAGPGERKSAAEDALVDPVRLWDLDRPYHDEPDPRFDPNLFWRHPPRADNRYALCRAQCGLFAQQSAEVVAGGSRRLAEAASLCALWDGRSEKGADAAVYVPRLSLHLVATPRDGGRLLGDADLADTALLGRFLAAAPVSMIGRRDCRETRADAAAYDDLCAGLLASYDSEVSAHRRALSFSEAAKTAWYAFAQEVESAMAPGKPLAGILALASRLPEHAARLAGVIALIEDKDTSELGAEALGRGIALARYYAAEALRIADFTAVTRELEEADLLLAWLQRTRAGQVVELRDIYRTGPPSVRNADTARLLMARLQRHGAVRAKRSGVDGPKQWEVAAASSQDAATMSRDVA